MIHNDSPPESTPDIGGCTGMGNPGTIPHFTFSPLPRFLLFPGYGVSKLLYSGLTPEVLTGRGAPLLERSFGVT